MIESACYIWVFVQASPLNHTRRSSVTGDRLAAG